MNRRIAQGPDRSDDPRLETGDYDHLAGPDNVLSEEQREINRIGIEKARQALSEAAIKEVVQPESSKNNSAYISLKRKIDNSDVKNPIVRSIIRRWIEDEKNKQLISEQEEAELYEHLSVVQAIPDEPTRQSDFRELQSRNNR
jgi:hypothetical protein